MGIPIVTRTRVIMSPRRLRSSMNRVAIIPAVGIGDPRCWWLRPGTPGVRSPVVSVGVIRRPIACDIQEPGFERGLDLLEPIQRDPAVDQEPGDLGDGVSGVPAGNVTGADPAAPGPVCPPRCRRGESGPFGFGAPDLDDQRGTCEQFGDRGLSYHSATIDDRHRVTGPLDLVEEVGGEHDRPPFGDERQDHLPDVLHAGRVEPVHRLVEDQQLGIADQTGGDAEALAHAHRVLGDPVVGAVGQSDVFE